MNGTYYIHSFPFIYLHGGCSRWIEVNKEKGLGFFRFFFHSRVSRFGLSRFLPFNLHIDAFTNAKLCTKAIKRFQSKQLSLPKYFTSIWLKPLFLPTLAIVRMGVANTRGITFNGSFPIFLFFLLISLSLFFLSFPRWVGVSYGLLAMLNDST